MYLCLMRTGVGSGCCQELGSCSSSLGARVGSGLCPPGICFFLLVDQPSLSLRFLLSQVWFARELSSHDTDSRKTLDDLTETLVPLFLRSSLKRGDLMSW